MNFGVIVDPRNPAPAARLVVAGDREPGMVAFEEEMVSFFVSSADALGVPKSLAAIYGIVFASPEPLTFSQIQDRLAISNGSVSQGLKVLREIGAVDERGIRGGPGRGYSPNLELRKLIGRILDQKLGQQLKAGQSRLEAITGSIPSGAVGEAEELKRRVNSLIEWHRQASALIPLARALLIMG